MGKCFTHLKKHVAGGFSEVTKRPKVPYEIRHSMKIELESTKTAKKKAKDNQDELDKRTVEYPLLTHIKILDFDTKAAMEDLYKKNGSKMKSNDIEHNLGPLSLMPIVGPNLIKDHKVQLEIVLLTACSTDVKMGQNKKSGKAPNITDIDLMTFPYPNAEQ